MSRLFLVGPMGLLLLAGCAKEQKKTDLSRLQNVARLEVTSPAFGDGGVIPKKYTAEGENVSPPLRWSGAPATTRSFALVLLDPNNPIGTREHWMLYNLPSDRTELPEGVPNERVVLGGARQGVNGFGKVGYSGPVGSPGRAHTYRFVVYALDAPLEMPDDANHYRLQTLVLDHMVGQGVLLARYPQE